MTVLLLDAYHLGDPLFLSGLARDLAARPDGLVLVHGSGERGERALEALGLAPTATDGVWATGSDDEAAAVERATRELNRSVVHELNEAGVASVRAVGADRGLLKTAGDGRVVAGRTAWLADLVRQRVVVVVAALVDGGGGPLREADAARSGGALAEALGAPLAVLSRKGLDGPASLADATVREALGDAAGVGRALGAGGRVVAVGRGALREGGSPGGPEVVG